MVAFIDQYRNQYGVEPICKELPIAPSTYYHYKTLEQHPERRSVRTRRDEYLKHEIQRIREENHRNYGARKVWKQLKRESIPAARCTVERLMKKQGIKGIRRGRRCITAIPSEAAHKPLDLVNREFSASHPNQLWVADITYGVPGAQGKHGCLNEPRVYLKYIGMAALANLPMTIPGCAGVGVRAAVTYRMLVR